MGNWGYFTPIYRSYFTLLITGRGAHLVLFTCIKLEVFLGWEMFCTEKKFGGPALSGLVQWARARLQVRIQKVLKTVAFAFVCQDA